LLPTSTTIVFVSLSCTPCLCSPPKFMLQPPPSLARPPHVHRCAWLGHHGPSRAKLRPCAGARRPGPCRGPTACRRSHPAGQNREPGVLPCSDHMKDLVRQFGKREGPNYTVYDSYE
jgi:hypothetical protein